MLFGSDGCIINIHRTRKYYDDIKSSVHTLTGSLFSAHLSSWKCCVECRVSGLGPYTLV